MAVIAVHYFYATGKLDLLMIKLVGKNAVRVPT